MIILRTSFILLLLATIYEATEIHLNAKNWNISMETSLGSILSGFSALFNSGFNTISRSISVKPEVSQNSILSVIDPFAASIMESVTKISKNGCFYRGEICYKNLGCFSTSKGASKLTCFLPELPSFIRTRFQVYTRPEGPGVSIQYDGEDDLDSVPRGGRIVFLIHGYTENGGESDYQEMMRRLLKYTDTDAVIIVNCGAALRIGNFLRAIANTELVGRQMALLIEKLRIHRGIDGKNIHLVGFSLGAKVSHFACSWGNQLYGTRIGRVTGLDPGDHLADTEEETTLHKKDAEFVDIIHSSGFDNEFPITSIKAGGFGITKALGHVDFYPNGGYRQPWCVKTTNLLCNHSAARKFFIASLLECNFRSVRCESFVITDTRSPCKSTDLRSFSVSSMGYFSPQHTGRGIQYLRTKENYPYC